MTSSDHDTSIPEIARPSTSADSFSSGRRSPSINEFDSSAALIVVPGNEQDDLDAEDPTAFEFLSSSDDDSPDGELDDDDRLGRTARYSSGPALSSLTVFVYLLSPLLKLGALLSSSAGIAQFPLRLSLPALFFFASLCAFTRQIWYMLARYVKRADMEEIVLQTFARGVGRGREGERKRRSIQLVVRSSTGLVRVLLIAVYLRGMCFRCCCAKCFESHRTIAAADYILPLLPAQVLHIVASRVMVTLGFALVVSPLCVPSSASLGAATVLWATWISVATYVIWVAGAAYAHAKAISIPSQVETGEEGSLGALWQGLSTCRGLVD